MVTSAIDGARTAWLSSDSAITVPTGMHRPTRLDGISSAAR
jgi:hypothetical protein